jgi:thiol-disulfide isomerase/thioredoxin
LDDRGGAAVKLDCVVKWLLISAIVLLHGCSNRENKATDVRSNDRNVAGTNAVSNPADQGSAATKSQIQATNASNDLESALLALDSLGNSVAHSPNDVVLLKQFRSLSGQTFASARRTGVAPAQQVVDRLKSLVSRIVPGTDESSHLVDDLREWNAFCQRYVDASQTSTEEIEVQLTANPDDVDAMLLYEVTLQLENDTYYEKDPELALKLLAHSSRFLATLRNRSGDGKVRETAAGLIEQIIPHGERNITEATARLQVLGQEAVYPDSVEAWINGPPLTKQDLKGKVVLLDFWALWCGPCVEAIPKLGTFHEKYAKDGLVIIGVTDYYGYTWDERSGSPVQPGETVENADERKALEQFLVRRKVPFPCVIDPNKRLSLAYSVGGLPHVVLIDRHGKVCLVRTGASKETVDDIESRVVLLLDDSRQLQE